VHYSYPAGAGAGGLSVKIIDLSRILKNSIPFGKGNWWRFSASDSFGLRNGRGLRHELRMKFALACLWLWPIALFGGELPPAILPDGVGVNIHFAQGHQRDADLIAAGGFRFILPIFPIFAIALITLKTIA
jgi:hypothetical protein